MAGQSRTNQNFTAEWGYFVSQLSLKISPKFTIHRILPKSKFFGLHFRRRQYGSSTTVK